MAKKIVEEPKKPEKHEYVYTDEIGTDTWIFKGNTLIEVKFDWSKDYLKAIKERAIIDESLPKSKRKYLNPANGKYVGYARARDLGFFED